MDIQTERENRLQSYKQSSRFRRRRQDQNYTVQRQNARSAGENQYHCAVMEVGRIEHSDRTTSHDDKLLLPPRHIQRFNCHSSAQNS